MFRLVPHRPRVGTVAHGAVCGQQAASAASVWALNEIQPGFVAFAVFTLWVLTSGDVGLPCVFSECFDRAEVQKILDRNTGTAMFLSAKSVVCFFFASVFIWF